MNDPVRDAIGESISAKQATLEHCVDDIQRLCDMAVSVVQQGGTLFFCGNGGSSCDAAHAAGELVGWFENKSRKPVAAVALGQNAAIATAVANDSGYQEVFARELDALAKPTDLLVAISTSGESPNVHAAVRAGREIGMKTAALSSTRSDALARTTDVCVAIPSDNTARIQECHLLCVHILCAAVESRCSTAA